jgi:hypothetical protein
MQRIESRALIVHHCVPATPPPFKQNLGGSYSVEKLNRKEMETEVSEHGEISQNFPEKGLKI